jgi:uncharacterized protein YdeI (YjbR/CyaY-like superfamily)
MKAPRAEVEPHSCAEWRDWLNQHHAHSSGVWLIWHSKRSGRQCISVEEAVLEALCFGWIDSRLRRLHDGTSALLFTPRQPSGTWSRLNKQRVESLIASGLMTEAGLRAVETAQRNGSWSALDPVEELELPDDLSAAFAADPLARRNFDAFPPSTRKPIVATGGHDAGPPTRPARRLTAGQPSACLRSDTGARARALCCCTSSVRSPLTDRSLSRNRKREPNSSEWALGSARLRWMCRAKSANRARTGREPGTS